MTIARRGLNPHTPNQTDPDRLPGLECAMWYLLPNKFGYPHVQGSSRRFAGVDTTPEKKDGSENQDPGVGGFRFTRDFVARQSWRDVEDGGLP
jgi:hypothetical protein